LSKTTHEIDPLRVTARARRYADAEKGQIKLLRESINVAAAGQALNPKGQPALGLRGAHATA
jgi:hypothetical protein